MVAEKMYKTMQNITTILKQNSKKIFIDHLTNDVIQEQPDDGHDSPKFGSKLKIKK